MMGTISRKTEEISADMKDMKDMKDVKDVRLTVVGLHGEENDDEIQIDFGKAARELRRMLALWLCLAVGLGAVAGAVGLAAQRVMGREPIRALVNFSFDDSAADYDIRKIKSPGVVEDALNAMGLKIDNIDVIRNAIEINGVIPDSAHEYMGMYYDVVTQGGAAAIPALQSLLNTQYDVTQYIVSFDYPYAGMSRKMGIDFVNTLLRAYQDYFAETYNYNEAMGNPLSAVDYREYDYAEAANIFSTALDSMTSYLSAVESSATTTFRSVETGFTFQDLRRAADTLRNIDLDRVASYIVIHSVSSYDAETEISYYQWLIENLTRQRTVERTRLASLTRSISEYEKDPVLVSGQDGAAVLNNLEDLNGHYDTMITEGLDTQATIASYTRSISYYERVIEGFRNAESANEEEIEKVEGYLSSLNEKLNALFEDATKTVDEYYDKVAFANRMQVLIPATARNTPLITKTTVMMVVAVEALLFAAFCAVALAMSLKKPEDETSGFERADAEKESRTRAENPSEKGYFIEKRNL